MDQDYIHFSKDELLYILSLSPNATAIHKTEQLTIEFANDAMINIWGKGKEVIGKPLEEALPELKGQPFIGMLQNVWRTGVTVEGTDTPAVLNIDGELQTHYFDFSYRAILDNDGKTFCILHTATNVTERYKNRQLIAAAELREKDLNEELAATNEELAATNEELRSTNEELSFLNDKLIKTVDELQESKTNLQLAIEAGKLGTWIGEFTSNRLLLTQRSRTLHGIPDDVTIGFNESFEMIVIEDRNRVQQAIQFAIKNKSHFEEDYRIDPMDGSPQKWLRANGKVEYSKDGNPIKILGTMIDITERKLDDIRKNDFIAMVSHELKTPLTSMKAFVQLLEMKINKNNDAMLHSLLQKADAQTDKMTKLINNFLNVSRLDAGKIQLHKTACSLNELIKDVVKDIKAVNYTHDIHFLLCPPIKVTADCEKISQVISNLLSNAIKYSPAGKRIEIACEQHENRAQVSVKDEGIGIAPEDIHHLFERFYRASAKHNETVAGFGIGLYLCAEIIHQHNGKIWIESEVGKGSVFYFTLPL